MFGIREVQLRTILKIQEEKTLHIVKNQKTLEQRRRMKMKWMKSKGKKVI